MADSAFSNLPNTVTVIGNAYVFGIDDTDAGETKGVTWQTIKANLNIGDLNDVTIQELDSSSGAITRLLAKVSDSSGAYWTDLSLDDIYEKVIWFWTEKVSHLQRIMKKEINVTIEQFEEEVILDYCI